MKRVSEETKLPEGVLSVQLFVPDMFGNDILITRREESKERRLCPYTTVAVGKPLSLWSRVKQGKSTVTKNSSPEVSGYIFLRDGVILFGLLTDW